MTDPKEPSLGEMLDELTGHGGPATRVYLERKVADLRASLAARVEEIDTLIQEQSYKLASVATEMLAREIRGDS